MDIDISVLEINAVKLHQYAQSNEQCRQLDNNITAMLRDIKVTAREMDDIKKRIAHTGTSRIPEDLIIRGIELDRQLRSHVEAVEIMMANMKHLASSSTIS